MTIDYTLDVCNTFCEFARACMADGRIINVWDVVIARKNVSSIINTPSWAPDWTRKPGHFKRPVHAIDLDSLQTINLWLSQIFTTWRAISWNSARVGLPCAITGEISILEARIDGALHTEPIIITKQSILQNLAHVIKLYQDADMLSADAVSSLSFSLWQLWNEQAPDRIWDKRHPDKLSDAIGSMWDFQREFRKETKEWLACFADSITNLVDGYCFFMARFADAGINFVCYGTAGLTKGDCLVQTEEICQCSFPWSFRTNCTCAKRIGGRLLTAWAQ